MGVAGVNGQSIWVVLFVVLVVLIILGVVDDH
jgi:hypothetical protein